MSKPKKKRKNTDKANYEVGYCKPPKNKQWKKGCKSPNPLGRPKKITSIKEALKVNLGKEITTTNENGEECKISCADAIVRKTIKDAITKDGPTRRLLFRNDLLSLEAQEPEIIYEADEQEQIEIEKRYAQLLKSWAAMPEGIRNVYNKIISEALRDYINENNRKENKND